MARRFLMNELRTVVARALNASDYAPSAVSARVRAVPDTRTIRYYTTLGLLSPPAEMRGRVAYYDETHVLQIVAIKQLQAQSLSLLDIQQKLVGLTSSKLETIANLPADFWKAVDRYLKTQEPIEKPQQNRSKSKSPKVASNDFWLETAALPTVAASATDHAKLTVGQEDVTVIRISGPRGIKIIVELPLRHHEQKSLEMQSLMKAANPFIEEILRQQFGKR